MPDLLAIISKAQFEAQHPGARVGQVLPIDRYVSGNKALAPLSDGGALFLVTVRPPDEQLWLVAILESPTFDGTQWVAATNQVAAADRSGARDQLKFTTGKGIAAKPGALGMSLQTPRQLTAEDAKLLRGSTIVTKKEKVEEKSKEIKAQQDNKTNKEPPVSGAAEPGGDDLGRAGAALAVGDRSVALTALAAAWRRCRAPELEALVDVVSADAARALSAIEAPRNAYDEAWQARERQRRVVDLPHLLAGLTHEPLGGIPLRLRALLDWDADPRVGPVLLAMVKEPPFTASSNFGTWSTLFKALPNFVDTRATATLKKRAATTGGTSQFWPKLVGWIESTLPKLPAPAELSPADKKRVAALRLRAETLAAGPAPSVIAEATAAAPVDRRPAGEKLASALTALKAQDGDRALTDLSAFWADKRTPAVAERIEKLGFLLAGQQPPVVTGNDADTHAQWMQLGRRVAVTDVTRLLAGLTVGKIGDVEERLAQMLHWPPDPRVPARLLAMTSDYMIGARPILWRTVYDLFVHHADPRSQEAIVARNQLLTNRGVFHRTLAERSQSERTIEAYRAAVAGDTTLTKSEADALAQIGQLIDAAAGAAAAGRHQAQVNDEALVAEIVARWDDDAPRLVYADLLAERGDVRGDYITMAVAQARGAKLKSKLEAYERKHRKALLGPLEPVVDSYGLTFARGFLDSFGVKQRGVAWDDAPAMGALLSDLRWATVTTLTFGYGGTAGPARVVLQKAPLGSLRKIVHCDIEDLDALLLRDETFRFVEVQGLNLGGRQLSADLLARWSTAHRALPALRKLSLWSYALVPVEVLRVPLIQGLAELVAGNESTGGEMPWLAWLERCLSLEWRVPSTTWSSAGLTCVLEVRDGHKQLTLTMKWLTSRSGEWASTLARFRSLPVGLVDTVVVDVTGKSDDDRAAILAALAQVNPTTTPESK